MGILFHIQITMEISMVINEFDPQGMHCKHCKVHIIDAAAQNHHFPLLEAEFHYITAQHVR